MKKGICYLIFFFLIIIGYVSINVFIRSRKEYAAKYDFIITKIEMDAKGNLTFYDSLNYKYSFASYRFSKWDKLGISEGDKVFKDDHSKDMMISRKKKNVYKIYHIQEPNGMIPFSFYYR